MAKAFDAIRPGLLGRNTNSSQGGALYDAGLTGDARYQAFDLCEVNSSGVLVKVTTPLATTRYVLSNHEWPGFNKFTKATRLKRPMWYRRFNSKDLWIMNYAPAWAESVRGSLRELEYNINGQGTGVGNLEVAAGTTNPKVRILYPVYEMLSQVDPAAPSGDTLSLTEDAMQRPEVGDYKVPVLVEFLEGAIG